MLRDLFILFVLPVRHSMPFVSRRLMAEKISKNERKNESDIGTYHQGEETAEFWTLIGVAEDEEPPAEDEIEVRKGRVSVGGWLCGYGEGEGRNGLSKSVAELGKVDVGKG